MRVWFLASLLGLALSFAACGGRTLDGSNDGSGADTGLGAAASDGGTSSQGARPSKGGAAGKGGAKATGGTSGKGGAAGIAGTSSVGGACACDAIGCGPGYFAQLNANGCCFHCEPLLCPDIPCALIGCGPGSHIETLPGQCCPTCVQDSCEQQRAAYQRLRQQLVDKYSTLGCMTNNDCTLYYEKNQCEVGCGMPMPVAAINNLDSNLQNYAQQSCTPACMAPIPPCVNPGPAACRAGVCVYSDLLK